jgi:hypothetical protein
MDIAPAGFPDAWKTSALHPPPPPGRITANAIPDKKYV